MDDLASSAAQFDPSKLNDTDKRELQQFLQNEAQKSSIQSTVHTLTDLCWKKCVPGKISSGKMDSREETCVQNCVDRYMDSQYAVLQHLEQLRAGQ